MKAFRKKQLFILKAVIKGLAEESKMIRRTKIQACKNIERYIAYENKKLLAAHTRACLLAYALLQGKRYEEVESNVSLKDTEDYSIKDLMFEKVFNICSQFGGSQFRWNGEKHFTREKFLQWIKGGPNTIFLKRQEPKRIKAKVSKITFGGFNEKK